MALSFWKHFISIALVIGIFMPGTAFSETAQTCVDVIVPKVHARSVPAQENLGVRIRNEFDGLLMRVFPRLQDNHRRRVLDQIASRTNEQLKISQRLGFFSRSDRNQAWEADTVEIVAYPDQVSVNGNKGTFGSLNRGLMRIQNILAGMTRIPFDIAAHVLPFFESPKVDDGYDVSDYKSVRSELGGMKGFEEFSGTGRREGHPDVKVGRKIVDDIMFNHGSDKSEEFQRALKGDQESLDMFVTTSSEPILERREIRNGEIWMHYLVKTRTGIYVKRQWRLLFPDIVDSHWRKETLPDGRTVWFFHYYYAQQPDWNWDNPAVLLKHLDLVSLWVNKGVDIHRLDSILFLDKRSVAHPRTLAIIEFFQTYLNLVAPHVHMRNEAADKPEVIAQLMGDQIAGPHPVTQDWQVRNERAGASYYFPLIPNAFASFFEGNKKFIEESLKGLRAFVDPSALTFITRTHDELTLEGQVATPEVRSILRRALLLEKPRGQRFRGDTDETAMGISGSTAEFFDFNPKRILSYFAFYLSLPGQISFQLRDLYAMGNSYELAVEKAKSTGRYDSRSINRGDVPEEIMSGQMTGIQREVFEGTMKLIAARMNLGEVMRRGSLVLIDNPNPRVLTFIRSFEGQSILVIKNISDGPSEVSLDASKIFNNPRLVANVLTGRKVEIFSGRLTLSLGPDETLWIGEH